MILTRKEIETVLSDIVKDDPDHVYLGPPDSMTCYYTHPDGSAGCIFGRALDVLGIDRPAWDTAENTYGIMMLLSELGIETDHQTLLFMAQVQERQDGEESWGQALGAAQTQYPAEDEA